MSVIWAAIISGAATIIAVSINGWLQIRATGRVHSIAVDTNHLVNSTAELAQNRNDQLVRGLIDAGVPVPLTESEERLSDADSHE